MSFGKYLKELRKSKKLGIKDVADKLGVHFSTISKWETEKSTPNRETLIELSRLYDVDIRYLMIDDNSEQSLDEALSVSLQYSTPQQKKRVLDFLEGKVETPVEYTATQNRVLTNIQTITPDDLITRYSLTINGRAATQEEIKDALEYLQVKRIMKEQKDKDTNSKD